MKKEMTLEIANEQLDSIIEKMESGGLTFDESLKYYKEAFELLEYCYKHLNESKLEIVDIQKRIDALNKTEELFDD